MATDWVADVLRKMEHHAAADHVLSLNATGEALRSQLDEAHRLLDEMGEAWDAREDRWCKDENQRLDRLAEAIRMGRHLADYIDSLDHRECHVVATKARTRYDELEAGS